jgi:hypothetical protein
MTWIGPGTPTQTRDVVAKELVVRRLNDQMKLVSASRARRASLCALPGRPIARYRVERATPNHRAATGDAGPRDVAVGAIPRRSKAEGLDRHATAPAELSDGQISGSLLHLHQQEVLPSCRLPAICGSNQRSRFLEADRGTDEIHNDFGHELHETEARQPYGW